MSLKDRVSVLEGQKPKEQDTIIPKFQTPDTCVFCTDKDYDSIFYHIFRLAYNQKTGKDLERQDKENCIHNTDQSLKHSLRSAGFTCSAFLNYNKHLNSDGVLQICKFKRLREELLTKKYDESKHYASWMELYQLIEERRKNHKPERYSGGFTIEDDCVIQDKILQDKIKLYYDKAREVLSNFD